MAEIKPFRAIRPRKDKVASVASRSYDEYSSEELGITLKTNPFSFLQIITPGFRLDKKLKGIERFKLVHKRYLEFLRNNVLMKDANKSFYLYEIKKDSFNCSGLFCATSTSDYRNNIIRKHENTISHREKLFADYLGEVKFNAEPVLVTYEDHPGVAAVLEAVKKESAENHFTTPDETVHTLWKISDKKICETLEEAFANIDALYIADGHHRSASSDLWAKTAQKNNPNHIGSEPYNYFMSYILPESQIKIYEYNRIIKDLNGLSKDDFLLRLDKSFRIENNKDTFYKPLKKHHFCMYLDGEFYSLYLREEVYKFTDALSKLDTQILFKIVLGPILGIADLRNDKRIQYGCGKENVNKMKKEIDAGNFVVGFSMVPITVDEIKAIADAGLVMPPKSTYIEPKLRSGLVIYELSD